MDSGQRSKALYVDALKELQVLTFVSMGLVTTPQATEATERRTIRPCNQMRTVGDTEAW